MNYRQALLLAFVAVVPCVFAATTSADRAVESKPSASGLPLTPTRHIRFDTDEGTWVSLDVSPDGRSIVFELLGDLYQMGIRGGTAQPLTHGLPFDSQPRFSPDGNHIVFVSDRSGNENVWIAGIDGGDVRQISMLDDNMVFTSPTWSADGRSIYVSEFRADITSYELWRYPVDGSGHGEQITHAKAYAMQPKDDRFGVIGALWIMFWDKKTKELFLPARTPVRTQPHGS